MALEPTALVPPREVTLPLAAAPPRSIPVPPRAAPAASAASTAPAPIAAATVESPAPRPADDAERRQREALELQKAQQDAEAKGFAEGQQRAQREHRAAAAAKFKRLDEIAQALDGQRVALKQELEDAVVELTMTALLKVLGEAPVDAQQLRASVQAAIVKAGYLHEPITVHLAPADYDLLAGERADTEPSGPALIRWEADSRVVLGGCILESPRGHLDLRLETRLERLKAALLDARRQRS